MVPPRQVLECFGVRGEPTALEGGQGGSFLADGVVLKRADDGAEASWTQATLSRLEPEGFMVARPVAARDGAWVVDGWLASEFVPGLRPLMPDWPAICQVGLAVADALGRAWDRAADGVLRRRVHRWAVADRAAWGEESVVLGGEAAALHGRISEALRRLPQARPRQDAVIHGDLSGNVHLDEQGIPVVLDISPYLRPREWGSAIVVADAVLWYDAPPSLAEAFVADAAGRAELLARALVFRLVAGELGPSGRSAALTSSYGTLASLVEASDSP